MSSCFEVRSSAHELGGFATRDIEPGERIIAEPPLVSWASRPDPRKGHDWTQLKAVVDSRSDADKAAFYSLAQSSEHGEAKTPYGIWCTNAYPTPAGDGFAAPQDGVTRSGVFSLCCRFNHACKPNAHIAWNAKLGKQTVHALCRIQCGHEILVAYVGGDTTFDRDARRKVLASRGFVCGCELCSLRGEELAASEERQRRIASIHTQLPSFPPDLSALVDELLTLLNDEGLPQVWATSPMFAALLHEQKRGAATAAARWAQRGAACARGALGTDHRLHEKFEALRVGLSAKVVEGNATGNTKGNAKGGQLDGRRSPSTSSNARGAGGGESRGGGAPRPPERTHSHRISLVDESGLLLRADVGSGSGDKGAQSGTVWLFASTSTEAHWRAAGRQLSACGYAAVDDFFGAPLALAMREQALTLYQQAGGEFRQGRVGGGADGAAGSDYSIADVCLPTRAAAPLSLPEPHLALPPSTSLAGAWRSYAQSRHQRRPRAPPATLDGSLPRPRPLDGRRGRHVTQRPVRLACRQPTQPPDDRGVSQRWVSVHAPRRQPRW